MASKRKRVLYFFAFRSPFAAIADFRIDQLIESTDAVLEPLPLVPPAFDEPSGFAAQLAAAKVDYQREDAARCARKLAIPWQPPPPGPPVDETMAVAGYFYARDKGQERNYRNAVFRSRWCEGKDIGDQQVLAECAEDCQLSPNTFLQAIRSKLYHAPIERALLRCLENQVFGVPTFVFNGQRFWGNDRIDFLIEAIRKAE